MASPVVLGLLCGPSMARASGNSDPLAADAVSTQSTEIPVARLEKPAGEPIRVPAMTAVEIETVDPVDSKSAKIGDTFAIRLIEPVRIDGKLILPVGTSGVGEVTHVAKAGWGGKAGELIVTTRFVQCGNLHIPLGHFHFGASGETRAGAALGASMIIPFAGILISGGEMLLQAGTRGNAKISRDVFVAQDELKNCASL